MDIPFHTSQSLSFLSFPNQYYYIKYFLYTHPEMLRQIGKEKAKEEMHKGAREFGGYNGKDKRN